MICAAFKTLLLLETTFWKLKMLGANLTCMSQRNSAVFEGTIFPMFLAMVILIRSERESQVRDPVEHGDAVEVEEHHSELVLVEDDEVGWDEGRVDEGV